LTNSSGIHVDKVGEFVQMALLMLNAQLPAVLRAQHEHRWDARLTAPIRGKTVLLIGLGDLGLSASRVAKALGLRVLALNRSGRTPESAASETDMPDVLASVSELDRWLPEADFVVVTAPLTPATRGLLSATRLAAMRQGACVVNLSRAALVDYPALFERLRAGACGGAVLDVFEPEPLAHDSPVWDGFDRHASHFMRRAGLQPACARSVVRQFRKMAARRTACQYRQPRAGVLNRIAARYLLRS
jgi:phosphoglycerate dehydrogenase-like enzyme